MAAPNMRSNVIATMRYTDTIIVQRKAVYLIMNFEFKGNAIYRKTLEPIRANQNQA